mmetsp:Transcript_1731/g.1652  ORF Transcript_1731/g.1652 Transcript_1731/m.1652 type:complete len:141 (-) Transcript_1731:1222-1644(-)
MILVSSLLLILSAVLSANYHFALVFSFKTLHVFKVLRYCNPWNLNSQHMKMTIDTLVHIFPPIMYLCMIIFMLIFIFAILGMALFAGVPYQKELDEDANFRTLSSAILLLFRCMTMRHWSQLMYELSYQQTINGVECVMD